jgi:cytochrome c553
MCGKAKPNMTIHHGIPQHLKPEKNIMIPICRECHDKVNYDDVTGMYAYLFKIEKTFNEGKRSLGIMKDMLDQNTKHRENMLLLAQGKKIVLGGESNDGNK